MTLQTGLRGGWGVIEHQREHVLARASSQGEGRGHGPLVFIQEGPSVTLAPKVRMKIAETVKRIMSVKQTSSQITLKMSLRISQTVFPCHCRCHTLGSAERALYVSLALHDCQMSNDITGAA